MALQTDYRNSFLNVCLVRHLTSITDQSELLFFSLWFINYHLHFLQWENPISNRKVLRKAAFMHKSAQITGTTSLKQRDNLSNWIGYSTTKITDAIAKGRWNMVLKTLSFLMAGLISIERICYRRHQQPLWIICAQWFEQNLIFWSLAPCGSLLRFIDSSKGSVEYYCHATNGRAYSWTAWLPSATIHELLCWLIWLFEVSIWKNSEKWWCLLCACMAKVSVRTEIV